MAANSTLMAGLSLAGGIAESNAIAEEGKFQKSIFETNARFSELQAEDSIKRGEKEAERVKRRAKQLLGKQRTALAAQGIVLDDGTALQIQEDTAEQGAVDAMTARNNAWREAWGFKTQALDYRTRGRLAELSARTRSRNALLTGGMQAAKHLKSGSKKAASAASMSAGGPPVSTTPNFGSSYGGYA